MKNFILITTIFTSMQCFGCENFNDYLDDKLQESMRNMLNSEQYAERKMPNANDCYWYLSGRCEAFLEIINEIEDKSN